MTPSGDVYSGPGGFAVADFGVPGNTVGNFDPYERDSIAEIVVVSSGYVALYTLSGQRIFKVTGISGGGPPVVGDFDLDGLRNFSISIFKIIKLNTFFSFLIFKKLAEIASANGLNIRVFDLDCRIGTETGCSGSPFTRWVKQSQDFSSQVTSSAIFQFSSAESPGAVYADECFVRVYKGETGEVLFSSFRTSCTWLENPVIANTDGVAGSEVIVGSNNNCPGIVISFFSSSSLWNLLFYSELIFFFF